MWRGRGGRLRGCRHRGRRTRCRPAFRRHVGAEVYLGEMREPGDGGQEVGPYAGHVEGYDAEPGAAFEVSMLRAGGTRGLRSSTPTGQCMKSRSRQLIPSTHGPEGTG